MIVLPLSRGRPKAFFPKRRVGGILPRLFLTQGFQSVCGVLKTMALGTAIGLGTLNMSGAAGLRVQEIIVADPWSGVAIGGFDPVGYFIEQRPVMGSREHQMIDAGVLWNFASESNRVAYLDSPETYQPVYGGHDPVMVASGVPVAGHPEHFAIVEGRLYLFRRAENRNLFLENPNLRDEAALHWPKVLRQLAP